MPYLQVNTHLIAINIHLITIYKEAGSTDTCKTKILASLGLRRNKQNETPTMRTRKNHRGFYAVHFERSGRHLAKQQRSVEHISEFV